MAKFGAFYDTRNQFLTSTGYTTPLSYDEWKEKPEDLKVAFLYLQFYDEITLAWEKADARDFGDDAEGVSTVLQYLQKQVSQIIYYRKDDPTKKATAEFRRKYPDQCIAIERRILDANPKKFAPGYIYKTAYNCMYCITGHDRKRDKDRMDNETSAVVMYEGEELNLFDTMSDRRGSASDVSEANSFEKQFWSVIEDAGLSAEKVMRYLLSENRADLKALNCRSKQYAADPLRDVEVSLNNVSVIIDDLRERFLDLAADSSCGSYISTFAALN